MKIQKKMPQSEARSNTAQKKEFKILTINSGSDILRTLIQAFLKILRGFNCKRINLRKFFKI